MKLLLIAALRNKKHLSLALFAVFSLFFLTIADQMERFSLGLISSTGADFFVLFSDKKETEKVSQEISKEQVEKKWKKIAIRDPNAISKKDASLYIAKKKVKNPLIWIMQKFSAKFDFEKNFGFLISMLMVVALFKALILFFSRYATQLLSIRITRDLRAQYFQHIQSLPLSFYQEHNLGTLAARAVGDAGQIASSINSCFTNYLQTPFTILTTLYLCFFISWKLSLIIFVGLPLIIFPVIFLTKRVKKVAKQMQRNQENFTSVLLDFLSGIHTVKVFAMEAFTLKKFSEQNDRMAQLESKSAKYSLLTRPILHTITTACLAIVVIIGLYSLHMTMGQLLVFCALLHLFYEPVKKFAEENANIQKGVIAAERMFEVLHLTPQIQDRDGAIDLREFREKIEFKDVCFRYNKKWILKHVSFTVTKGETVAIVGPTGAGKSTIVHLLPRLFDIEKGHLLIDGVDVKHCSQKSLRELISVVPQKPFLFYDTILENIKFGRDYSKEEIEEAAQKAGASEFIENLPLSYDSIIADSGKTLSGGQQQRLTIARALVKKAPILILDEATSSLDAVSESWIKKAVGALRGNITQIIIAHRLSTIAHADKIIYLENGAIISMGTKEELLATCKPFQMMWQHYHRSQESSKTALASEGSN